MKSHSISHGILYGLWLLILVSMPVHTLAQTLKYFGLDGGVSLTKGIGTSEGAIYKVFDSVVTLSNNSFGKVSPAIGALVGLELSQRFTLDCRVAFSTSSTESFSRTDTTKLSAYNARTQRDTILAFTSNYNFYRDWNSIALEVGLVCLVSEDFYVCSMIESQLIISSSERCHENISIPNAVRPGPPVGPCVLLPESRDSISKLRKTVVMAGLGAGYNFQLSTKLSLRPFAQCKYSLKPLLTTAESHVFSMSVSIQALYYL